MEEEVREILERGTLIKMASKSLDQLRKEAKDLAERRKLMDEIGRLKAKPVKPKPPTKGQKAFRTFSRGMDNFARSMFQ